MHRHALLALVSLLLADASGWADDFDNYTNPILRQAPGAAGVQEVKQLTPALLLDNDRVLKGTSAALLIIHTNDNRWAKLLVQSARHKVDDQRSLPILLIERFVTFKEGQERAVQASGKSVYLFPGFRFNLDIGQVVPDGLDADLRFVAEGDKIHAEPVGKAKLYLVTKPLPDAAPKKGPKLVVGPTFEPRYYSGTFQLYDDGRRSGRLTLKLEDGGALGGTYVSDRDGREYEVRGKVGTPAHSFEFTIKFPRSEQTFRGWLFTGDAKVMTGSSRLLDREAGFYAVRVEE